MDNKPNNQDGPIPPSTPTTGTGTVNAPANPNAGYTPPGAQATPTNTTTPNGTDGTWGVGGSNSVGSMNDDAPKKKMPKKLIAIIVAVVLLLGGGAFAAITYINNTPEKIMADAYNNFVAADSFSYDTTTEFSNEELQQLDYTVSGVTDTANNASSVEAELDLVITKLTGEFIYIDGEYYFKLGGLQGLGGLLGSFGASPDPEQAALVEAAIGVVDNQWIQIDRSILENIDADYNDTTLELQQRIKDVPVQEFPLKIEEKLDDEEVNGKDSYHLVVSLDREKIESYLQRLLVDLEVGGQTISEEDVSELADEIKDGLDEEEVPDLDVWIDKESRNFNRISIKVTDDATQILNLGGFNDSVAVEKPSDIKTLLAVVSEVYETLGIPFDPSIFDEITSPLQGAQENARDTERRTDINALHAQIEAYYADNGFYPTEANIDDVSWVEANLPGLDAEALKTPDERSYSYTTSPANCDNGTTVCASYTLSTDLEEDGLGDSDSDGNTADYAKDSLN